MLSTGKDALIYAQSALEREASEPERLNVFWGNARKHYEDSKPKA
jgi:predicted TIM-barrel fold metal-dependent hydrolase